MQSQTIEALAMLRAAGAAHSLAQAQLAEAAATRLAAVRATLDLPFQDRPTHAQTGEALGITHHRVAQLVAKARALSISSHSPGGTP